MNRVPYVVEATENPDPPCFAEVERVLVPKSSVDGVRVVVQFVRKRVI